MIKGFRRNKYGAVRTYVDGIAFASKAEAKRYNELKLLEKGKAISGLRVHPRWDLHAVCQNTNERRKVGTYEADFCYFQNGELVVEDVKGFFQSLSKWKIRHFEAEYGLSVTIVGGR